MSGLPLNPSRNDARERLLDLLADEATVGLTAQEHAELEALSRQFPDVPRDSMQLAAAAIDLAEFSLARAEPMPASVRARIPVPAALALSGGASSRERSTIGRPAPALRLPANRWAWLAAAACLGLAAIGWWPRLAAVVPQVAAQLPYGQARLATMTDVEALRAVATDMVVVKFAPGPDPSGQGLTGELHWSPSRQEGYMVFAGLKANDPAREQYQLWIFDAERDERHPVHGGVFDIPAGRETVVVRVEPRLTVPKANMFVVTVERPGGVWVSDRSRIPALAKLSG
jgi:hypothetical protein